MPPEPLRTRAGPRPAPPVRRPVPAPRHDVSESHRHGAWFDLQRTAGNAAVAHAARGEVPLAAGVAVQRAVAPVYAVAADAVRRLTAQAGVAALLRLGFTDVNTITNIFFWIEHPEMWGRKIEPGQKELAAAWLTIRDRVVRPAHAALQDPGRAGATSSPPAPGPVSGTRPSPEGPTPAPQDPPPAGDLRTQVGPADSTLSAELAALGHPMASAIDAKLADLQSRYGQVERQKTEEKGTGRDELVTGIAELRAMVTELDGAGLEAGRWTPVRSRVFSAVNAISPFYSQGRNTDLLEGEEQAEELGTATTVTTRTCNITSLAMALESLGRSAADYQAGLRPKALRAAEVFAPEVRAATLTVRTDSDGQWGAMVGLRLSDFLQLAAVAEELAGPEASVAAVRGAAKRAWGQILTIGFLKTLASRFGVEGTVKSFTLDTTRSRKEQAGDAARLRKLAGSNKRRGAITRLAEARNAMEAAEGTASYAKKKGAYETQRARYEQYLSGESIESELPLAQYRDQMIEQVGGEMAAGSAVVMLLKGHYVRVQSLDRDEVIVDDPGRIVLANLAVNWDEARAMAYFAYRLVLG